MLFNKRKREEKKRLQEEERKHLEKSKSYAAELTQAQEALAHKNPLLQKGLQLAESAEAKGLLAGFKAGLAKTRRFFSSGIFALQGEGAVTEQFLEELEEGLLAADLGVVTAVKVMDHLRDQVNRGAIANRDQLLTQMRQVIGRLVTKEDHRLPVAQSGPTVYLFVGVNGAGKTTSIAKLASQFQAEGKKVLAAAGDTFRAAAVEQLEVWCKRAQIDMVKKELNSDPAAVLYEACEKAVAGNYDILLCDTSGRLHTKGHLMEELKKMKRALQKVLPKAPHASILVLDANIGQNAIMQTREFSQAVELDGLIVTKLDGTAKGGVVVGIVNEFDLPIYYVGVGERIEDLQPFHAAWFAENLF